VALASSNLVYHFFVFFSLVVSFFFGRVLNMRSNSASYFLRFGIGRGREPFPVMVTPYFLGYML
jgi:hypothetical protein